MAGGGFKKAFQYLGMSADKSVLDDLSDEEYYDEYPMDEEADANSTTAQVTPITRANTHREMHIAHSQGGELRRITTLHPRSYNDARVIGEAFRSGIPVIINLSDMDDADAKRLVDFSAGLIFGLRGAIERVTNKVFLLSPENIEVLAGQEVEAEDPNHGATFFNQS